MSTGNLTERKGIFTTSPNANVKVEKHPLKGRVLVAQKDFAPGDEILSVRLPSVVNYLSSSSSPVPQSRLDVDGVLTVTRDGCVACNDKRCLTYCDRFRRYFMDVRAALNASGSIAKLTGTPNEHVRLAIKFIALRQATLAARHSPSPDALDAIFELNNVRDSKEEKEQDKSTAEKILAALPASHKDVLKQEKLADLLGIIYTNGHHIHGHGIGLFPVASMIEHSCAPNSAYEVVNDKLTVTALLKIAKGEGISLCYIRPYQPRQERIAELKNRFHFDCTCVRCSVDMFNRDLCRAFRCKKCDDGIVTPLGFGNDLSDWKCDKCDQTPAAEVFQEMIAEETTLKLLDTLDVPVDTLLESSTLHQSHYVLYRSLEHRVKVLARLRPNIGQTWLLILLDSAKRVLPEYHPDKAVFYDMLGQVRKLLSDLKGAKEAFNEAWQIREKSNGKASTITAQAKAKRDNPERVDITLFTTY